MYVAMNGFSVAIDTEKNIIRRWSYILNTLRHVFFSYFNIYLNFHSLEIKYYIYLTLLKQVSFAIINEGSRLKKGRKILHNIIFPWAHTSTYILSQIQMNDWTYSLQKKKNNLRSNLRSCELINLNINSKFRRIWKKGERTRENLFARFSPKKLPPFDHPLKNPRRGSAPQLLLSATRT